MLGFNIRCRRKNGNVCSLEDLPLVIRTGPCCMAATLSLELANGLEKGLLRLREENPQQSPHE